jgi:hypothetical protein
MKNSNQVKNVLDNLQVNGPPPGDGVKKKRRVNSGSKGDGWENMVARLLTRRFEREFSKMPDSGARGTASKLDPRAKEVLTSDIICPEGFLWTLECKKGYDIDLWSVFTNHVFRGRKKDVDLIEYFTTQALNEARSVGKKPCVIYRKDNRPAVAMVHRNYGGDEVFNVLKPTIYLVWNEWYIISLYELLVCPNEMFFTPETCPAEVPVGWDKVGGSSRVDDDKAKRRRVWMTALAQVNIDGLGIRELLKMPHGHAMRQNMMPEPFDPVTVDEFIAEYQQPDEAIKKVKRLITRDEKASKPS